LVESNRQDLDVIPGEGVVPSEDDRVKTLRLGDEHPVERVAVMRRQATATSASTAVMGSVSGWSPACR
jgi:hypothetical protein